MAVIFDLEFTAWDGSMRHRWLRPGEFREIVQIGAVRVDPETLEVTDRFDILVKPRVNPAISLYLEKLTGIASADVAARGRDLVEAYDAFRAFVGGGACAAFGRDDLIFAENARLYGERFQPLERFHDLRPWFDANGFDTRGVHSCEVEPRLGVAFEGHTHTGLADSLSVAAGMKVLVARGAQRLFA
ncbi:MAG: exonuclease domain-containing protein [Proteobacteria bacterium]|nr:exonuclease domain-containing protein [Pseudomonadota bacterium]